MQDAGGIGDHDDDEVIMSWSIDWPMGYGIMFSLFLGLLAGSGYCR